MAAQEPPPHESYFGGKDGRQESAAPSKEPGMDENDFPASSAGVVDANALLAKGVKVAFTNDSSTNTSSTKRDKTTQYGSLSLDGNSLKFAATKPKKKWTTIQLSSIRNVELNGNKCRLLLMEAARGSSFSFLCMDDAWNLARPEVTDLMSRALEDIIKKERRAVPPDGRVRTYGQLLEPLGLADTYCAAFQASRIPLENLGVVTRDDLAELVGVTDKLDQINIITQIKRERLDLDLPTVKLPLVPTNLKEGVRVVVDTANGGAKKGRKEMGCLKLVADRLKFDFTEPKKREWVVALSSIRNVEQQDDNWCKVWLNEEGGNSSFSFACPDLARVKLSIEQALSRQPTGAGDMSPFAVLLESVGLADKYCVAFKASRVPFENLGHMTRDDLAELLELVGVTDRLDQINIKAEIKRHFPELPSCSCRVEHESDNQLASGLEATGNVLEGFAAFFEALAS